MTGHFDENDKESWFFGGLTFDQCNDILINEDVGVFLVRDSSRGGFVLCVKEQKEVAQYPINTTVRDSETKFFIRDELSFRDLPSMLAFYKRNLFESTALVRPISRDCVDTIVPIDKRKTMVPATGTPHLKVARPPSAPPVLDGRPGSRSEFTPRFARVIKNKNNSAYNTTLLQLRVGDVISVSQIKDGYGEGQIDGRHGKFPLTHVELITPNDAN